MVCLGYDHFLMCCVALKDPKLPPTPKNTYKSGLQGPLGQKWATI